MEDLYRSLQYVNLNPDGRSNDRALPWIFKKNRTPDGAFNNQNLAEIKKPKTKFSGCFKFRRYLPVHTKQRKQRPRYADVRAVVVWVNNVGRAKAKKTGA